MKVFDLTHPITSDLPVYFPWHPATTLEETATYKDNRCVVRRLSIGTHSGTHIDAPSHVLEGGFTMDAYDPSLWFMAAQVVDFTPREPGRAITADEFQAMNIREGIGVIVKTGWDVHFGSADYYKTYPPITNGAAEFLVSKKIKLLAADTPFKLDVHYTMLRKGIPLVTNLNNMKDLPAGIVKLIAAPLLIANGDGAPARVLAVVED
ncbi:MAG: cyclase family protein [Ignavibacteriae bacterium]|nr:cyclase family protein [Ignavibacteriota bacterium]